MQPEEQQRIMGYFIEEAKDHLNTIEQGLLSLQATIEDSEKANEIFRAAHSVKGGAAMLGLESIQKTAHRMEDYFKILKESPVQVDRVLETMFLRISDGLKDLLEQLEGPFGLTQDKAQEIMAGVEPVFGQIEAHLGTLVSTSSQGLEGLSVAKAPDSMDSPEAAKTRFKRDGASFLRKMLAAFKRPDNEESRNAIQDVCAQLYEMGEQFGLSAWCDLIETARLAAASRDNDYRALAPILIKDIKQAQDLVLAGRASEIAVSDAMQVLLPEDILEADAAEGLDGIDDFDLESSLEDSLHGLDFASDDDQDFDFDVEDDSVEDDSVEDDSEEAAQEFSALLDVSEEDINAKTASSKDMQPDNDDSLGELFGISESEDEELAPQAAGDLDRDDDDIERLSLDLSFDEIPSELSMLDRDAKAQEKTDESLDALLATVNVTGPEVGEEELNSLADLFDGDLEELDNTLGGHAFATEEMQLHPEKINISSDDDLTDLLSSDDSEEGGAISDDAEIEDDLFGGTLTDGEFAIAKDTDFDDLDLSTDPWDESEPKEITADSEDDIFGVDLDLEIASALDVDEAVDAIDIAGTDEDVDVLDLDSIDAISVDDVSELSEEITEAASEETLDEDVTAEKTVIVPQIRPSHTVSPKEEDIEFPTLTGQELQEAEEDIDNFFWDEDEDDSTQQLEEIPWGEVTSESETTTSSVDFGGDEIDKQESADEITDNSVSLDFVAAETAPTRDNDEDLDADLLDSDFLEAESTVSFDIDLDVEQAGDELDELLEDEESKPDVMLSEASSDDLWDELVLDAVSDDAMDSDGEELSEEIGADAAHLDDSQDIKDAEAPDNDSPFVDDDFDFDLSESDLAISSEEMSVEETSIEETSIEEMLVDDSSVEALDADLLDDETESVAEKIENNSFDLLENDTEDNDIELGAEQIATEGSDSFDFSDFDIEGSDAASLNTAQEVESEKDLFSTEDPSELAEELVFDPDFLSEDVDSEDAGSVSISSEDVDSASISSEGASKDVSGDELSDEILADFETAFGTGVFDTVASEEMLVDDDIDSDRAEQETKNSEPESDALNISALEIDGLLDDELDEELDGFLTEDELAEIDGTLPEIDSFTDDGFDSGLADIPGDTSSREGVAASQSSPQLPTVGLGFDDGFDDLDALLSEDSAESSASAQSDISQSNISQSDIHNASQISSEGVGDSPTFVGTDSVALDQGADEDFGDLERLLEDGPTERAATSPPARRNTQTAVRRSGMREQTMRVSVSHLDTLSNLVGELVVSRNTLERDQERLRQFLDNLLFQVQQLNDVGQRMRDLYERSLLESSLMSNRRAHSSARAASAPASDDPTAFFEDHHATGETFDALEMDRFTGFHTLSQEMIELIVRVRESSSDIGYTVESSDQVTRQFRQITTQLQEGLNTARMVAFSQAADRLPRAVRDISLKCGKEARLIVEGQDTLIDKMIVEHLYDPLTHLVNNAITHGIETPEERKAAGKLPEGSITVRAFYQGNQTVIYVADDGGGINTEFVKRKAIEKKLITQAEAEALSDIETYDLLFHAGFSTRDQADDFAGRGVGMDVVRTSLAEIRGSITIDSEMGKGTSFTIRLPLTLSISKALSCVSNQARIAFPMDGVEDMLDVPRDRVVKNDKDQDCIRWRDTLLSFQPVTELLKFNRTLGRGRVYGGSQEDDILSIIVLRSANTYIAVQVDQVIGEQEIVIKQLEGPVPKPLGIAGATVLGDGRVMPIADVIELIDIAMGRVRREPSSMLWSQEEVAAVEDAPVKQDPTVLIVDDSITVRELLSMSFNKVGYRVEQARDGQEAWDKLRSGLPCDLVFCDIEMPRMDGLELLSRMQKDNHLKSIPIAMLTSRGADRHRQMAVDLGASGYFTKPYLEEALLDAAQRMLNGETLAKGRGG